jgi:hypothetical protein
MLASCLFGFCARAAYPLGPVYAPNRSQISQRALSKNYRYLVEDFVVQFCHNLQKKDFVMKTEEFSAKRKGKREYLKDSLKSN